MSRVRRVVRQTTPPPTHCAVQPAAAAHPRRFHAAAAKPRAMVKQAIAVDRRPSYLVARGVHDEDIRPWSEGGIYGRGRRGLTLAGAGSTGGVASLPDVGTGEQASHRVSATPRLQRHRAAARPSFRGADSWNIAQMTARRVHHRVTTSKVINECWSFDRSFGITQSQRFATDDDER